MDPGKPAAPPRVRARARGIALQEDAPVASTSSAGSRSPAAGPSSGRSDDRNRGQRGSRSENPGSQPQRTPEERYDIIRADLLPGTNKHCPIDDNPVPLVTNYFPTRRPEDWVLLHYNVEFSPQLEHTFEKKRLLRPYAGVDEDQLGTFIFDGSSLITTKAIQSRMREITTVHQNNPMHIRITPVRRVEPGDATSLEFFNILLRKCLEALGLLPIGRHFYDSTIAHQLPQRRLELWQGFVTTLRQHDAGLLYGVGITHRVLRLDTVYEYMMQLESVRTTQEDIQNDIVGTIVMTEYRRLDRADQPAIKTYRVDGIAWDQNPNKTFEQKDGSRISYRDYYRNKHGINISTNSQPLLVSRRKARDIRRGVTQDILLVPELCRMTGLTPLMRADSTLMRDLSHYLFMSPDQKLEATAGFVRRLVANDQVKSELDKWEVKIGRNPLEIQGRRMKNEEILFRDGAKFQSVGGDFTQAFRGGIRMVSAVGLRKWVTIIPASVQARFGQFIEMMHTVAANMGFNISRPSEMTVTSGQGHPSQVYSDAIDTAYNSTNKEVQMIFVVLPTNSLDTYTAVKTQCNVNLGLPSQCMLGTNLMQNPGRLRSIATKMVIQMNAKLGGEPWNVETPAKTTMVMVIGFDIYHGGARSSGQNKSIGAMVCTTTPSLGTYFSCVSVFDSSTLADRLARDVDKCCHAYRIKNNGQFPKRILFYRDGVGEGQLYQVLNTEVEAITSQLALTYKGAGDPPKFTFVVVSKRINTRLFETVRVGYENPGPGTVLDNSITLPERWDFYLISQTARQGVVSPTNYNIIYDRQQLPAKTIQEFTYRLCHLYYNWTGTVAVPAVCQYAHKLSYLTGMATRKPNHANLAHLLYFL